MGSAAPPARKRRRTIVLGVASVLLAATLMVGARWRAESNNRARHGFEVGAGRALVPAHRPVDAAAARAGAPFVVIDGRRSTVTWVSADNEQRRLGIDLPGASAVSVTALLMLDDRRVAFAATGAEEGGLLRGHFGVHHPDSGPRTRAVGPVQALALDAAGKLVSFVPCSAPVAVRDVQEWLNADGVCLRELGDPRDEPAPESAPLCRDCLVQAAFAAGGAMRAWLLEKQRESALFAVEAGKPRELARPRFHTGAGFVNAVAWAADGGSAIVGEFSGKLEAGGQTRATAGGSDAFVIAYDGDGRVRFARVFGDARLERATSAAYLADGTLRILVAVRSDVAARPWARLLEGRTATADALEIIDLGAGGEVIARRRYALDPPRQDRPMDPKLVGADAELASVVMPAARMAPLFGHPLAAPTSLYVVALPAR